MLSRNTMQAIDSVGCAACTMQPQTVRAAHPTVFLRDDLRSRPDYFANPTYAAGSIPDWLQYAEFVIPETRCTVGGYSPFAKAGRSG
jgi:hypothetical protein